MFIYYDMDTQYATVWEIPFVKPQNDKWLQMMKNL